MRAAGRESTAPATNEPVRLPGIFSDHMVLQQGMPAPVWGWAPDGEVITVTFRDQHVTAEPRDGKWITRLASLTPGGPDVLTVSGAGSVIEFTNVLVGEVWVCSGQSNMEWPMSKAFEPDQDIRAATNGNIRLFTVPKRAADEPEEDVKSAWRQCSPESVAGFSAVAYYFGRELEAARGVPIGLIQSAWGGSPAEAWVRLETLQLKLKYQSEILDEYDRTRAAHERALADFEAARAATDRAGEGAHAPPPREPWKPSALHNGMIAPLIPYAMRGVVWYQGESNVARAHQYRSLFPDLIRDWRAAWQQGDFPFLTVQLAPFMPAREMPSESSWAELREAQALAARILPNAGLVVTTDVGDELDIHPTRKAPVGGRLALAARAVAYGEEKLVHSGPAFKSMEVNEGRAILAFDHVGSGLEGRGGSLRGFSVAGDDGKFVWALAEIENDTVVVTSPNVPYPAAVRYGWADYPVVNLWNRDGLPAIPFRTDKHPLITDPSRNAARN